MSNTCFLTYPGAGPEQDILGPTEALKEVAKVQRLAYSAFVAVPAKGAKNSKAICLHSLRKAARVVQKLARHSDPRLTFNTYARTFAEAEQKAVTFLPNFGDFVLSTCLDKICTKQEISGDNHRHENGQDTRGTAFLAAHQIPPRGVEPLLPG